MDNQLFFSVIIPTLNEEECLPQLLENLLRQSFTHSEVVVVDGGSQDKTVPIIHEFQKKYEKEGITLQYHHSPKQNVSYQRNLGAGAARGEYLVFFDADVQVEKDFLKKIYTHIEKTGTRLVTTWCIPDDRDVVHRILTDLMNFSVFLTKTTSKPVLMGFNIIIRRDIFDQIGGFDETVFVGEDHVIAHAAKKAGVTVSLLRKPELVCSFRRLRTEGRMTVIKKYIRATLYIWFKGPIRKKIYEYNMGGSAHK